MVKKWIFILSLIAVLTASCILEYRFVNHSFDDLKEQIAAGNGNKTILISSDDEGNGYHTLWYTTESDVEKIKEIKEGAWFHDDNNPEDVVLLG